MKLRHVLWFNRRKNGDMETSLKILLKKNGTVNYKSCTVQDEIQASTASDPYAWLDSPSPSKQVKKRRKVVLA